MAIRNTIARIIQNTWKNYLIKIAPSGRKGRIAMDRDEKRLVTVMVSQAVFINDIAVQRGRNLILKFLRGTFNMLNLQLKIRKFIMGVHGIKNKILTHVENKKIRMEILHSLF
jgi:hypothetical protein